MKTQQKPNRLLLFIIKEVINVFKLTGDICLVILMLELLFGLPTFDGNPRDVQSLIYLTCTSYFISVVTTYFKIKLNRKR